MAITQNPPVEISLSPARVALRRALRHGSFWAGGLILIAIVLAAAFAPLLTPHDPSLQDLSQRFIPPVWAEDGLWDPRSARTRWAATISPGCSMARGSRC